MDDKKKNTAENQSVSRALAIMDLLATGPLGVRQVAKQLGFAPSIAQRLLTTMCSAGYLEQRESDARYCIGYKAFQVGSTFASQNDLHSLALPELEALAERHVTGFLGVLRNATIVYVLAVEGSGPVAVKRRPGTVTHAHSTALGKALLSGYPDEEIRALLPEQFPQLTPNTTTSIETLLKEIHQIRLDGYALNDQENRLGVFSVGAVIRDSRERPVAALSGAIPSNLVNDALKQETIQTVMEAAQRISRRLGCP